MSLLAEVGDFLRKVVFSEAEPKRMLIQCKSLMETDLESDVYELVHMNAGAL